MSAGWRAAVMAAISIAVGAASGYWGVRKLGPGRALLYTFSVWVVFLALDWIDTRRMMRKQKQLQAHLDNMLANAVENRQKQMAIERQQHELNQYLAGRHPTGRPPCE